jgi:hypothetical protein
MEGLVDEQYACELLHEHGIELPDGEAINAAEFVTSMLIFIQAVKEEEKATRRLNEERYRSAQSQTPYFA